MNKSSKVTLEELGINFKRTPLPDNIINIDHVYSSPRIKKSDDSKIIDFSDKNLKREFSFSDDVFKKSLGGKYIDYVKKNSKTNVNLEFSKKEGDFIWLDYDEKNSLIEYNTILVNPYCSATVVLDYSFDLSPTVHHGVTKIHVLEGGELNIVKLQSNHEGSSYLDQNLIVVEDRGKINVIDIQLGSKHVVVNYDANLKGFESKGDFKSIYLGLENKSFDLSYTANHIGRKTESHILGKGVLGGESKKVFRGTLNFEHGSSQSVGKEEEVVLLLSESVKSDSIPALMCSEDDVIGEHGASIGQLDEDKMFYLMTRGLSEMQAKLLIISSSFKEIVENIKDEDIKERALLEIDRRIKNVIV